MTREIAAFALAALVATGARASWYWPFGSDDSVEDSRRPRLSELMEPASRLIDEATDLAEDGKSVEAVEKYRAALAALDEIEAENRAWADKPEFATLRNKRAYVNATIDSLLLRQVKSNARAVAVSDTTALERKLAEEKAGKSRSADAAKTAEATPKAAEGAKKATPAEKGKASAKGMASAKGKASAPAAKAAPAATDAGSRPKTRRERAMADLAAGDLAAAEISVSEMLAEDPDGAAALNLKAALEAARGNFVEAERALDRAIAAHPRSPFAYYNMAKLILSSRPGAVAAARRYYETGRAVGGPRDESLEKRLNGPVTAAPSAL